MNLEMARKNLYRYSWRIDFKDSGAYDSEIDRKGGNNGLIMRRNVMPNIYHKIG